MLYGNFGTLTDVGRGGSCGGRENQIVDAQPLAIHHQYESINASIARGRKELELSWIWTGYRQEMSHHSASIRRE
jgi:hypothetical protein